MAGDDLTAFLDEVLRYDGEVEAALAEIAASDDPLDNPDFDAVSYINSLFPTEHSLASLDDTIFSLRKKLRVLDQDIQQGMRAQSRGGVDGSHALQTAQAGMQELMTRIRSIGEKAQASEQTVKEITRDIKSLDLAKRNLTASITSLNHFHMLVGGVDSLQDLTEKRAYQEAAHLLAAVLNVLEHFDNYKDVPQIRELSSKVASIMRTLGTQVRMEFRAVFHSPEPDFSEYSADQMKEACALLDVLGEEVSRGIVEWFVELQLRDYPRTFAVSGDQAWVDKVDRRFAWFKRMIATYLEHSHALFPAKWNVPQQLALKFCELTVQQLHKQLQERRAELDVKLLLFAVQKTTQFEQWLESKFRRAPSTDETQDEEDEEEDGEGDGSVGNDGAQAASEADEIRLKYLRHRQERERQARRQARGETKKKAADKTPVFANAISKIFEPCLDIYVTAQDTNLEQMLEQFSKDFKSSLMFPDDDGSNSEGAKVLPSSGDLFVFFRNSMVQCAALSTGEPFFNLYGVFKRALRSYCDQILSGNLPKASSLAQLLLKEAEIRLSMEEIYLVCSILNTAEYCQDTTQQLEEKLVEKLEERFRSKVDLREEQDKFYEVITTCTQVLVRALEAPCETALGVMVKMRWDGFEEVGDTSPYVSQIGKAIASTVPAVRGYMGQNRKYFTNFCLKFVNSFGPRVVASLKKCKHVSTIGAEQLLLDMQSIRMALTELPSLKSDISRRPPANYIKLVMDHMGKAEMILKVIMAPVEIPALFVQDYLKLVGADEGLAGFQKMLDMRGLKKSEQQPLLAAFKAQLTSAEEDGSEAVAGEIHTADKGSGAGKTTTKKGAEKSSKGTGSPRRPNINLRKLESLMKRFPSIKVGGGGSSSSSSGGSGAGAGASAAAP